MSTLFQKSADSSLDYTVDWSQWLTGTETIVNSEWTVPSGITLDSSTYSSTTATAYISGGDDGEVYVIRNEVTTSSTPAKVDSRSFNLYIAER